MTLRTPPSHRLERFMPLLLLLLCLLSFGLLIPWLGFYWDDWASIAALRQSGASGIWQLMGDPFRHRPLSGWTFVFFSPLAGTAPLGWQVVSLGLRWAAACALWGLLRSLWPKHVFQTAAAAMLFVVYPIFRQQPIAVTYHQHWTAYALFLASLWLMARAVRSTSPRRAALFSGLALAAQALHLAVFEYFAGAEIARLLVLWLLLADVRPWGKRAAHSLLRALPYALLLAAFIAWRMSISLGDSGDGNRPGLLFNLLQQPGATLRNLWMLVSQDVVHFLIGSWRDVFAAGSWLSWVGFAAAALLTGVPLALAAAHKPSAPDGARFWPGALLLGAAALLCGTLPIWLTGSQAVGGIFANRFGMAAMWGAALLWVAALDALLRRPAFILPLLALAIGLAVGLHLRTAEVYRAAWQQQRDYAWQLAWRAPSIQPNTAVLSADDIFPQTRRTFSLNLLYNQPAPREKTLPLWFYRLDARLQEDSQNFGDWGDQQQEYLGYTFASSAADNLVLLYPPAADANCLWLLSARDASLPGLPPAVALALPLSNPARVSDAASAAPPRDAFGAEPAHGWCYYFQKAELAAQNEDWAAVRRLGDAAQAAGFSPANPASDALREWQPFIRAYALDGQPAAAQSLTYALLDRQPEAKSLLCRWWTDLPGGTEFRAGLDCK